LLPAILLLVLHLLGWREMITILSGTVPEGYSPPGAMVRAAAYMLAWFGTVILTPILAIAPFPKSPCPAQPLHPGSVLPCGSSACSSPS
jgi:hypothetical protein